jgi:hypothetical protein
MSNKRFNGEYSEMNGPSCGRHSVIAGGFFELENGVRS